MDVINDNLITIQEAQELLRVYTEQLAPNFPYVVIPASISFADLRFRSPMLLLPILVTASWRNGRQQDMLNEVYLKELSSRVIIEGRKDLELLQGLLVYLAW